VSSSDFMYRSYASIRFSLCPFPHVLFATKSFTSYGSAVLQFLFKCLKSLAAFFMVEFS
jgi:hypothetical protein